MSDVLMLCLRHHEEYEEEAEKLRRSIAAETGIPLHEEFDKERLRIVGNISSLEKYSYKIPTERRVRMEADINKYLESRGQTGKEFVASTENDKKLWSHGYRVVSKLDDVSEFVYRWRSHFIQSMSPQYLPEDWNTLIANLKL
jgi:transcriptional regulator of NAD metabolism